MSINQTDILDSLSYRIAILDGEGVILFTNKAWIDFAKQNGDGHLESSVVGTNYLDEIKRAITKGEFQKIYDGINQVLEGKKDNFSMDYLCHSTTEKRWYALKVTPRPDAKGVVITHSDITKRILTEQELQKSEEKFRSFTENAPNIISVVDPKGNLKYINRLISTTSLKEDVIGTSIFDRIPEKYKELVDEKIKKLYRTKQSDFYEIEINTMEDKVAWIRTNFGLIDINDPKSDIIMVTQDVTESRKIEIFKSIIYSIPEKMGNSDIGLVDFCEYIHKELSKFMDTTNFYIAHRKNKDTIYFPYLIDNDVPKRNTLVRKMGNGLSEYIIKTGKSLMLNKEETLAFQKEKGLTIYGETAKSWLGAPIILRNEPIGVIACQSYTEENVYSEMQLSLLELLGNQIGSFIERIEIEERTKGLIEYSSDITCITDEKGLINYVSPFAIKVMGYSKEELVGSNVFDYIHQEDLNEAFGKFKSRYEKKGVGEYNVYRFITKKSAIKQLRVMMTYHFETPGINGFVINAQDITELMEAEKEKHFIIMKAEETERLRISHDLHDGLGQTIAAANMSINSLEIIAEQQLDKEAIAIFKTGKSLLNNAAKETRLVSHNIMPRSLKQFGLEQTVKKMLANYQKINDGVNIKFDSNCNNRRFKEEIELSLFRIIQESMSNALKHSFAKEIMVSLMVDINKLFVEIADNGVGFDVERVKEDKDAGIGLFSLDQRVRMIGGKLDYRSLEKKGTTIRIHLDVD